MSGQNLWKGFQILVADGALVEVDHPEKGCSANGENRPEVAANTLCSARLSIDSKGGAPIWPLFTNCLTGR